VVAEGIVLDLVEAEELGGAVLDLFGNKSLFTLGDVSEVV
jgi:hypothetical protein